MAIMTMRELIQAQLNYLSESDLQKVYNFVQDLVQSHKSPVTPRPRFGSAQGLITMSDDFDEPLADFEEYMENGT